MKGGRVERPVKYGDQNRWDKDYVGELMKTGIPAIPTGIPPTKPINRPNAPITP